MNIALLTTGFDRNLKEATKITILSLAKELKRLGHNPVIISDKRKHLTKIDIIEGIKVYRLYGKSKNKEPHKILNNFLSHALTIRKLEKKGLKFDIIHNFSSSPLLTVRGILAKRMSKHAKLIHSLKSTPKKDIWNKFTRILNFNDLVTVQLELIKNKLDSKSVKKIKIVTSHIDTEIFKPTKKSKQKVILYYGPLVERKGVKYLLLAIPHIVKEIKDVKFVFVIKKIKRKDIYINLLRNPEISKHVEIISEDINLIEYINNSSLAVFPYPNLFATESNPSCILECMACKTPVVSSDLPELNELFRNYKDILLAKPKDVNDLSKKIIELLKDKKLREKISLNGYEKSKKFDVKLITQKYLDAYKFLKKQRR